MDNGASSADERRQIFDSCLAHVEDFDDGPVSYCDLPPKTMERLWWTKYQKAVFIELIGRKGVSQLGKVAQIIGKSSSECEAYLDILKTAASCESGLPSLTYADFPAAVEDDEPVVASDGNVEAFTKVGTSKTAILNYPALMKKFNCVITAEAADALEAAIVERLKNIFYFAQFSASGPTRIDYMLDQYYEIALAGPGTSDYAERVSPDANGSGEAVEALETGASNGNSFGDESDEEYDILYDSEQIELEKAEARVLDELDMGSVSKPDCSAALKAYMELN